jgi:hypothetical protein
MRTGFAWPDANKQNNRQATHADAPAFHWVIGVLWVRAIRISFRNSQLHVSAPPGV